MTSKWQRGHCGTMPGHPLKVAGIVSIHVLGKPFIGKSLTFDALLQNHLREIPGEAVGCQELPATVHCQSLMLEKPCTAGGW